MPSATVLVASRIQITSELKRLVPAVASNPTRVTEEDKQFEREDLPSVNRVKAQIHRANGDRLARLEAALKRMEDGTYGICVDCGHEIDEKRLLAAPEAEDCISCRTKKDSRRIMRSSRR